MWFDAQSNLQALQHGTPANPANPANPKPRLAKIAGLAAPLAAERKTETTQAPAPDRLADAVDHFVERAAIRQFDGGQSRAEAEAAALAEAARAWGVDPEHILKIATEKD